ncbi:MAG: hypothetical protein SOW25_07825 [Helicobacter sp.]|nr:hypothetical protein [Helicobacter sp.]
MGGPVMAKLANSLVAYGYVKADKGKVKNVAAQADLGFESQAE